MMPLLSIVCDVTLNVDTALSCTFFAFISIFSFRDFAFSILETKSRISWYNEVINNS